MGIFDFVSRNFRFFLVPKIFCLDSIIFPPKKVWGFNHLKFTSCKHHQLLQHHQHNQHLLHPQHQQEKHRPTSLYLFQTHCFRWKQLLLGQKQGVFVCSELLWALELNETSFPFKNIKPKRVGKNSWNLIITLNT